MPNACSFKILEMTNGRSLKGVFKKLLSLPKSFAKYSVPRN